MDQQQTFKNVRDNALSAGAALGFVFAAFGEPVATLIATILGACAGVLYAESHNRKITKNTTNDVRLKEK